MKMGSFVRAVTAALVAALFAPSAFAAPAVDLNTWNNDATAQRPVYWDNNANGGHQQSLAQSFVAGKSGLLTQIDLELVSLATPTNILASLWQGDISSGSAIQLGQSIQLSRFSEMFLGMPTAIKGKSIDFSGQGVTLSAGQTYTVVANPIFGSPGIPGYQQGFTAWAVGLPSGTAGAAYSRTDTGGWISLGGLTLGTRTFIDDAVTSVPEPASWAMMILGMGAVGFAMRRRDKNVFTTVRFA